MPPNQKAVHDYLNGGIMDRANVNEVALSLTGAVFLLSTGDIEFCSSNNSDTGNVLRFYVGDNKYVLSYNDETEQINLLERTSQGRVLYSFDNTWDAAEVKHVFSAL
jgi:hypothetical protein